MLAGNVMNSDGINSKKDKETLSNEQVLLLLMKSLNDKT